MPETGGPVPPEDPSWKSPHERYEELMAKVMELGLPMMEKYLEQIQAQTQVSPPSFLVSGEMYGVDHIHGKSPRWWNDPFGIFRNRIMPNLIYILKWSALIYFASCLHWHTN